MAIYQGLAKIYDLLMSGIDYEEWADYINSLVGKQNREIGSVLDIACGTGSTSIPLAKRGWRVTGVDLSLPMLQQARRKAGEEKLEVLFLQQDIRDLEFSRGFDLVTCYQDGLNYLLTAEDLARTFQSVYSVLNPGGLFIFDLNMVEKYSAAATGEISFFDSEEFSLIYETTYQAGEEIWQIKVTGFVKEEQAYQKFQEVHQEKHHHLEQVKTALALAGFQHLDTLESFSLHAPQADTRRIFIVAGKGEERE